MNAPASDDPPLPDAAALLGLDLPKECLAGVRDALAALQMHWRLIEDVPPA